MDKPFVAKVPAARPPPPVRPGKPVQRGSMLGAEVCDWLILVLFLLTVALMAFTDVFEEDVRRRSATASSATLEDDEPDGSMSPRRGNP
ncbi:MAG: hypothetical protein JSS18_02905 [Proteobacteria bacterium]|nr:hypothetical protein [Pseudomonadota bacterium]